MTREVEPNQLNLLNVQESIYRHAVRDDASDEVPVLSLPAVGTSCVRRRRPRLRATFDASAAIVAIAPAADRHRVCVAHAIAWARRFACLDPAGLASALRVLAAGLFGAVVA